MKLTKDPYGFNAKSAEGLFLRIAREVLKIQRNKNKNSGEVELVTIDTDENAKLTTVEISRIAMNWENGKLVVASPFTDTLTTTGTEWPWTETNHFAALVQLGIFLTNAERDSTIHKGSKSILSYSLESQTGKDTSHIGASLSAENIPLIVTSTGQATATEADEWLTGTIS